MSIMRLILQRREGGIRDTKALVQCCPASRWQRRTQVCLPHDQHPFYLLFPLDRVFIAQFEGRENIKSRRQ